MPATAPDCAYANNNSCQSLVMLSISRTVTSYACFSYARSDTPFTAFRRSRRDYCRCRVCHKSGARTHRAVLRNARGIC